MTAASNQRPFISRANHWDRNSSESTQATAGPAYRIDPDGTRHPGVIVSMAPGRFLILAPGDALRVANQIADTLAGIREGQHQ